MFIRFVELINRLYLLEYIVSLKDVLTWFILLWFIIKTTISLYYEMSLKINRMYAN